ncbi:MAG: hypothetical protein IT582_07480 [Opitutaceae bacterium]|nr:hypothetical protein [Opitutaceae bacterium]
MSSPAINSIGGFTQLAPSEDLLVRAASRTVRGEFQFDVVCRDEPAALLTDARLEFPGFTTLARRVGLPEGGARFVGRLTRPGFNALRVTATHRGQTLSGRDFFLQPEPTPLRTGGEVGYYVFLGCGDYPKITGREAHPLGSWTLAQWHQLLEWMGCHGMNRLWVLLNGYTLAYPSRRYPALRDRHARNARDNILRALIDHGHAHGVQTHLMLTTDGHARDFCHAHPAAARLDATGQPGPDFGLALEHPLTRQYIFDVLDEVLELYPNADGIAVHPTESDPDRFNPESIAACHTETGRDLCAMPLEDRRIWHNQTFARFLREFGARARARNPSLDLVMANCWWQDEQPAIYRNELPPEWRIAVWHYAWEDPSSTRWPIYPWVEAFGASRLLYMPASQSYLFPADPGLVMDRHIGTDRLISTAASLGVRSTIYFAGWDFPTEEGRLLDALLARHPAGGPIGALYENYFAARAGR